MNLSREERQRIFEKLKNEMEQKISRLEMKIEAVKIGVDRRIIDREFPRFHRQQKELRA